MRLRSPAGTRAVAGRASFCPSGPAQLPGAMGKGTAARTAVQTKTVLDPSVSRSAHDGPPLQAWCTASAVSCGASSGAGCQCRAPAPPLWGCARSLQLCACDCSWLNAGTCRPRENASSPSIMQRHRAMLQGRVFVRRGQVYVRGGDCSVGAALRTSGLGAAAAAAIAVCCEGRRSQPHSLPFVRPLHALCG